MGIARKTYFYPKSPIVRSITPILRIMILAALVVACSKNRDSNQKIKGSNRVHQTDVSTVSNAITNISEHHSMSYKSMASVLSYEYQALASPPALDYNQTSATCILRDGNLVYIGWHTHDPANYNGFAKYSGAVSCYEVSGGTWSLVAQLEFDEMDIHEMAFGAAGELYIVGQSNPDASGYTTAWGHRGAIIGKVELDGSGYPTAANYIEKPLTSFGANSVLYVGPNEIYTGTGNHSGHFYKLDDALTVLDSSALGNVKSINGNDLSGKVGILKGNRGNPNRMAKFYEFNVGGSLPLESAGTDMPGITTYIHERNEGAYYNNLYLSSSNQGLVEVDPSGPSVTTVFSDDLTLGVACDTDNEFIYAAAQREGLKVLWGSGTANQYDLIGTFAPTAYNPGGWYVSDVIYDQNNVFIVSGYGNVIFTELYPVTHYLTLNNSNFVNPNSATNNPAIAGLNLGLTGGYTYDVELVSSTASFGAGFSAWEGVYIQTNETTAGGQITDNYFRTLNGVGDKVTIDLTNQALGFPSYTYGFMVPGTPDIDDSGNSLLQVTNNTTMATSFYAVDMVNHRITGDITTAGKTVSLDPGRYEITITNSNFRVNPSNANNWQGVMLYTYETGASATDPTPNYQMTLNGLSEVVTIDLSNKVGATDLVAFLVDDDPAANESGSVTIEIRLLHD